MDTSSNLEKQTRLCIGVCRCVLCRRMRTGRFLETTEMQTNKMISSQTTEFDVEFNISFAVRN